VNEDQPLALHCGVTRKGLYIFTRSIVEVYVCLSVCLSVTPLSPIKTVQCKITVGYHKDCSFMWQNLVPLAEVILIILPLLARLS